MCCCAGRSEDPGYRRNALRTTFAIAWAEASRIGPSGPFDIKLNGLSRLWQVNILS